MIIPQNPALHYLDFKLFTREGMLLRHHLHPEGPSSLGFRTFIKNHPRILLAFIHLFPNSSINSNSGTGPIGHLRMLLLNLGIKDGEGTLMETNSSNLRYQCPSIQSLNTLQICNNFYLDSLHRLYPLFHRPLNSFILHHIHLDPPYFRHNPFQTLIIDHHFRFTMLISRISQHMPSPPSQSRKFNLGPEGHFNQIN